MKETTRTFENLLAAVYRRQDCPAPEALREILLGESNAAKNSAMLVHVQSCGYCQSEVKALAQITGIAIPAELLGYDAKALVKTEERVRKLLKTIVPKELPSFPSLWQLALMHGVESGGHMPIAAAAFSSAGHSRAVRIIHAALLLGEEPDKTRLDAVAKALHLTPKERAALAGEFIH